MKEFPGCTYCQPQVVSIGLTEKAAKEQGLAFKVGKFPFTASGKALAAGEPEDFVKSLASRKTSSIGRSGEFKGAWSDVGFTIYVVRFLRTFACDRQYVACAGTRLLCTDCRTSNCYTTDVDGSSLCRRKRGHRNRYSRNGANT